MQNIKMLAQCAYTVARMFTRTLEYVRLLLRIINYKCFEKKNRSPPPRNRNALVRLLIAESIDVVREECGSTAPGISRQILKFFW